MTGVVSVSTRRVRGSSRPWDSYAGDWTEAGRLRQVTMTWYKTLLLLQCMKTYVNLRIFSWNLYQAIAVHSVWGSCIGFRVQIFSIFYHTIWLRKEVLSFFCRAKHKVNVITLVINLTLPCG